MASPFEEVDQQLAKIETGLEILPAEAGAQKEQALASLGELRRGVRHVAQGGAASSWSSKTFLGVLDRLDALLRQYARQDVDEKIKGAVIAIRGIKGQAETFFDEIKKKEKRVALGEIHKPEGSADAFSARPTFILGNRRSGTTLLSWLLDSHPSITVVPENSLCYSFFRPRGDKVPWGAGSDQAQLVIAQKSVERFGEERSTFYRRIGQMIDGVFIDYARRQGSERWIGKELILHDSLELLDLVFGHSARYVFIYRHGFDVAASTAQAVGTAFGAPTKGGGLSVKAYLEEWIENTEATLDFVERHPERSYHVSYEDLVGDQERVARGLFEFVGEPWRDTIFDDMQDQTHHPGLGDVNIMHTGGKILKNRKDRWRDWPEPVLRQLARVANPTLARLGYDTLPE